MHDCDNLDGALLAAVDYKVVADRPEKDWKVGEVFPFVPHAREARQFFEGFKDPPDQAVSRIDTFIGNIVPEIVQILCRVPG